MDESDPALTLQAHQLKSHYGQVLNQNTEKQFAKDVSFHILKNAALLKCDDLKKLVPKIKQQVNREIVLSVAMKYCLDSRLNCVNRTVEEKIECVKYLIAQGVDSENCYNDSILMHVLHSRDLELVRAILEAKINNINSGKSYLHYAITNFRLAVDILLEYGADPNILTDQRSTPLTYAISFVNNHTWWYGRKTFPYSRTDSDNEFPLNIVNKLLKAGGNVNFVDKLGNSALGSIEYNPFNSPMGCDLDIEKIRPKIMKVLFENGADVNFENLSGDTALLSATSWSSKTSIQLLLDFGADVNKIDYDGDTVFHRFVKLKVGFSRYPITWHGSTEFLPEVTTFQDIVNMLIQHGADINMKDRTGFTLVQCCYQRQLWDFVKVLLNINCSLRGFIREGLRVGDNAYKCKQCKSHSHVDDESLDEKHQVAQILSEFGIRSLKCLEIDYEKYPSLQLLCRQVIRESLGTNIHNTLPQLHLPQKINNFISSFLPLK